MFYLPVNIIKHMNAKNGYLILMYLCIGYFITIFTVAPYNFIIFLELSA